MHIVHGMEMSSMLWICRIQWYGFCQNQWICQKFSIDSVESIQLLRKIKIHFTSDKDPYNFHTSDFQYFPSVYNRLLKHFNC